jgi:hypothetical protein
MARGWFYVIVQVKQRWSVMRWVTKNLLSRAPPCFGRHVKPLVLAAFVLVSIHQSALSPLGIFPFFLCVIHKEGLCPSSGDINRLMIFLDFVDLLSNKKSYSDIKI